MADEPLILFVPIGENPARPFGVPARGRACRLAQIEGFECGDELQPGRAVLLANMAYGWDPAWLKILAGQPRSVLIHGQDPVMAFVPASDDAGKIADAFAKSAPIPGYEELDSTTGAPSSYSVRNRAPFVQPLDPQNPELFERAAFDGAYDDAYRGVGDALTLYFWRTPAFFLARAAAHARISPNLLSAIGALLGLFTFYLFWNGDYWLGALSGFLFMALDIAQGKLRFLRGVRSQWGNVLEKGIERIHPPFWWWAWLHGLHASGLSLEPFHATMVLWIILSGYAGTILLDWLGVRRFGIRIQDWRPLDAKFALVASKTGPNLVILTLSLTVGRPDGGLEMVAWWSLISLIFEAVRFSQMSERKARGQKIHSWLQP